MEGHMTSRCWLAGRISSRVVVLDLDNIDTDQIIPARFLKTTSKQGLGDRLFHDWRYDADGRPKPGFVLNQPTAAGAAILVAGQNFGCGSSREHAPWALTEFGLQAVIGLSFADIFRQNALKNGLLPVVVAAPVRTRLIEMVFGDPEASLTVDLERQAVLLPGGETVAFTIDAFARNCLLTGVDELGYVLGHEDAITRYEGERAGWIDTLSG
jgi:3-isopropylmalate/(R)-2-methylmalate dehydratase small subunit